MKKNVIHAVSFAALSSILLAGCIEDTGTGDNPEGGTAVRFPTSISKTRAYDGVWQYGDYIGVYMIPASSPRETDWGEIEPSYENMKYGLNIEEDEESADVLFSGDDDDNTIVWPGGGKKFDFVAYYPYRDEILSGYIEIEIGTSTFMENGQSVIVSRFGINTDGSENNP